jgi:hypothetical protein
MKRGMLIGLILGLLISIFPTSARAPDSGGFIAQLEDAQAENVRLHRKLRKTRKANRFHAAWVRKLRAANRDRIAFGSSGVVAGFLCIHRFEGAWNDPNPPYWGGVQMDLNFQRTYGGPFLAALGTADNWPPFVQVAVSMGAYYSGRGYHPWPNTARRCGLL